MLSKNAKHKDSFNPIELLVFKFYLNFQKIIEEKNNIIIKQKNDFHMLYQQFVDKSNGINNTNYDNSSLDAMLNNNEPSNFS